MDHGVDRHLMVEINSTIRSSEGEKEQMTLTTEAQYQVKEGKGYLRYEESAISGMEGSKMLLKHEDGKVIIRRYGSINTVFTVAIEEDYDTLYRTQYGEFLMKVIGREIKWLDDEKLDVFVVYTLLMEGNTETSEISISIKEM